MTAYQYLFTVLNKRLLNSLNRLVISTTLIPASFGEVTGLYPELDQICTSYFKLNLLKIIETWGYKDIFEELKESRDERLKLDINSKFRKLVQDRLLELTNDAGRAKGRKLEQEYVMLISNVTCFLDFLLDSSSDPMLMKHDDINFKTKYRKYSSPICLSMSWSFVRPFLTIAQQILQLIPSLLYATSYFHWKINLVTHGVNSNDGSMRKF